MIENERFKVWSYKRRGRGKIGGWIQEWAYALRSGDSYAIGKAKPGFRTQRDAAIAAEQASKESSNATNDR